MMFTTNRATAWLLLALLVLAAYAVRVHRLNAVPLRGDEAYSIEHWTATPFSDDWRTLWRDEPAPVGAFTLYWAWSALTGRSEFAARYLSLLGTVAGLAAAVALAHRLLKDWRAAALAGILWAAHPYLIWHAQDARVYGVLSALSPLAFYWLLRALDDDRDTIHPWLPYIGLQTAGIYIYYLEPMWLAAQAIFVLSLRRRKATAGLARAWTAIAILSLPVITQLYTLMFVSEYKGNAESAGIDTLLTDFVPSLLLGERTWPLWAGGLAALLLVGCAGLVWRRDRGTAALLAAWIAVPLILLYIASFVSEFFRPRYVTTVVPALILLVVAATWHLVRGKRRVPLAAGITLLLTLICAVEVYDYFYTDPPKAPDWPGLMAYLDDRTTARDVLLFGQPDPAIEYYHTGPAALYIIPLDWPDPEIELDRLLREYEGLYVMAGDQTGAAGQYLQTVAQAIPGDTRPGVTQFRAWQVDPAEIQTPLDVPFGDLARLQGYTLLDDETLILYWEALETAGGEHSILLHVQASPDAPPAAVLDHGVAGAVVSMRTWTPGTLYRDPVALPPDLPPGDYTLYVGVYETASGTALTVDGGVDGRYPLGTLIVR